MATTITVPAEYGYVPMIALGGIPLMAFVHGVAVTAMRGKAGVFYPHHYATPEQAKANPAAYRLNCAQRAHGQFLENMPQTMLMMLVAGLRYPVTTKWLGLCWMGMRALYWAGYVFSAHPKGRGRYYGNAFWAAQGWLWFLALKTAALMV